MSTFIFYIIIVFVVGEYVFSQWLAWRNRKAAAPSMPLQLQGLYDEAKYAKQQSYFRENNRLSFYSSTFNTLLILVMFVSGGFGALYEYCAGLSDNNIAVTLIYFAILFIAYDLLNTPFAIYDTFVIEQRFGFNKTTKAVFITDKLKGWLIGGIIGALLISVIVFIYDKLGSDFWWAAFLVVMAFSLIMTMFYSQIIVPLFNKQTPLPDGELRDAIEAFSAKEGFRLDNIYVIDGSKRSTKANAYFTGLGSKKRIVLYDTLINDLATEEIVAVLAHEMGHYRKKHTLIGFAISAVVTLVQFYILSYVLSSVDVAEAMGMAAPAFAVSLIAFAMLYTPVDMLTGVLVNSVSRRNEYQADNYAASFGLGEGLISGLKKITLKALVNLTPDKLYVKVYYSHPTLLQRIENIRNRK